jgi:hypothetical protein
MAEGVKLTADHIFVRPKQGAPPIADMLSAQEPSDAAVESESGQA